MKTAFMILIAVAILVGGGYIGVPLLIDRHTLQLRNELKDVKQRLQKIEEDSQVATLQPDAGVGQVVKTVNAIALKLNSVENSLQKGISSATDSINSQKAVTDEAFRKQAEIIEQHRKETLSRIELLRLDSALNDIREHILKARMDTIARNIGNAKTELDLVDDLLSGVMASAPQEQRKPMSEIQASVKKAKTEIDADLPSAVNRINNMWHDLSRLLRKG